MTRSLKSDRRAGLLVGQPLWVADQAASDKDELWDRVLDELVEVKFRPDLLLGFGSSARSACRASPSPPE
ncbi:hypothetical protein J8F10_21610 [Gemmata sp. G18]|uniref:Uncharacterized protein n=1 Tax=Gemmata palustris TaxID=2822762 RepID=A0ABS5BVX9_9BACT|nr:hypothetical protein [Gemmata palustris]MBP3957859.1 hypothetical protein [Gemmata palustris]